MMVDNNTAWWCNNHLEKYEFVNGKDYISQILWKIKKMFETTNQINSLPSGELT